MSRSRSRSKIRTQFADASMEFCPILDLAPAPAPLHAAYVEAPPGSDEGNPC
jgi:hypothetical protein